MADDLASKDENIVFEIENDYSSTKKKRASDLASMTEVKKSNSFQAYHEQADSSQKTHVRKNSLNRGVSPEISFSPQRRLPNFSKASSATKKDSMRYQEANVYSSGKSKMQVPPDSHRSSDIFRRYEKTAKEVRQSLETSPMMFNSARKVDLVASTNKVEEILQK